MTYVFILDSGLNTAVLCENIIKDSKKQRSYDTNIILM